MRGRKGVAAVLAALAMAVVLTACGAKVDLKQYVTAEFDGANEHADIRVTVDYNAIAEAVNKSNKGNGSLADSLNAQTLSNAISYSCDKAENISNGDTVTVTFTVPEELTKSYDFSVTNTTMTFKAENLPLLSKIDAFADVNVHFSGSAPFGTASVENNSGSDFLQQVDFQLDKTENLSNGDTVTVTAVYDDYLTETYGCIPESDTKTYTVEGLDSYMTSFDGLPDGALDEVHTDSRDRVESLIANKEQICGAFIDWSTDTPDTYQVDTQNLKLYTSYLLVSKGADFGAKYSNRYIAVYHTTGSMSKKSWFGDSYNGDMYIAVDYKDLKFDESGNLIVNLTDAEYTYFTTADNAYNYWMTSNKDCYKVFEQKAVAPAAAPAADAATADTAPAEASAS